MDAETKIICVAVAYLMIGAVIGLLAGWGTMSSSIVHDCRQWGGFEYLSKTFNCSVRP